MVFESTYLMLKYFNNKNKNKISSRKVTFNNKPNIIEYNYLLNNDSDETLDNRCYPYNQKNIVFK